MPPAAAGTLGLGPGLPSTGDTRTLSHLRGVDQGESQHNKATPSSSRTWRAPGQPLWLVTEPTLFCKLPGTAPGSEMPLWSQPAGGRSSAVGMRP